MTYNKAISLESVFNELRIHGVLPGDIIILHTSMKSLSCTRSSPNDLIEMFISLVGPSGTVVMPSIPHYKESVKGINRITKNISNQVWTYDVQKTPPWTGILPHTLSRLNGAKRGRYPLNTIVAFGAHRDELFSNELKKPFSTPCGPDSAWACCANKNAKILALGVDLVHNLTMIHVAEDCYEEDWPIPNWYRKRSFLIRDNDFESIVHVRERKPKWSIHYAERKLDHDLNKYKLLMRSKIGPITITSIESARLISFLNSKKHQGYPYYMWR